MTEPGAAHDRCTHNKHVEMAADHLGALQQSRRVVAISPLSVTVSGDGPGDPSRRLPAWPPRAATRQHTCVIVSNVAITPASITHLFVYGTLRPGDVRWHHLAPFVVDEGWDDSAAGSVFDTGLDYPAATFDNSGTIHGRTYGLLEASQQRCLEILDEIEGVVDGEYRRIQITTGTGTRAWSYEYGAGLDLTLIESGDWMNREHA